MKIIYYLRVFFISYEFLIILASGFIYLYWGDFLKKEFEGTELNIGAVQYFALLPFAIAAWTIKEACGVILPEEQSVKVLNDWPEYWRLKAHFYVGIMFCALFVSVCIFIWIFSGLKVFAWFWIYCVCVLSLVVNAGSFYFAKITMKEQLLKLS